ncbi:MAG: Arc family DNA-binding protein, partial [Anaerolineales bacterium]|nr:Arc family DNA-binding protein [Anaerolineales bacterium]
DEECNMKRFTVSLPIEIYEKLKALAERNRRTLTQQVLVIIEQALVDVE